MNESLLPRERLALIGRLNGLPQSQFDALVYALNPPAGVVPGDSAPQGIRSAALLEWVESSGGRGVAAAQDLLEEILSKGAKPKSKPLSLSRYEELLGNGTSAASGLRIRVGNSVEESNVGKQKGLLQCQRNILSV
jgi:hypothetical protein